MFRLPLDPMYWPVCVRTLLEQQAHIVVANLELVRQRLVAHLKLHIVPCHVTVAASFLHKHTQTETAAHTI
jgi:hypothetical protein